jgi:4a-hydroxytetrahydrobiopterin dehydratase
MKFNRSGQAVKLFKVLLVAIATAIASSNLSISIVSAKQMMLSETAISAQMNNLPGWMHQEKTIVRTFTFKDFIEAIDFVNKMVEPAEKAGHHPDLAISYNKVTVSLTTHDAGGLTQKDFDLAKVISKLYGNQ